MDAINDRWKNTDRICRCNPKILKACFFGGALVFILFFLTVPQACHVRFY